MITQPCPFCGEKDDLEEHHTPDDGRTNYDFAVRCKNCGATGPPCPTWKEAQRYWDAREE